MSADEGARRANALRLYLAGADHAQIARSLGYAGEDEARTDVTAELETRVAAGRGETKEMQRTAAALQLDRLMSSLWGKLKDADPETAEKISGRLQRLIAQKIDLLGLKRGHPPPSHLYETPPAGRTAA